MGQWLWEHDSLLRLESSLWTGNCANISSGSEAGSFHLFLSHKRNDPVSNPLDWFDCFPTFIIPIVMKELHQTASPYSTLTGNCVGCMPALIIIENEEQTMSERPFGVVDVCSRMEMIGWFPSHRGERITAGSLRRHWRSLNWTRTDGRDRHITKHFPGPTQIIRRQKGHSVILWWCDYLRIRTCVPRIWKGQHVKRSLSPGPILIICIIPYEPGRITERSEQLDRYFDHRVPNIPHPRNHLCNIVCSPLMICYVLNTCSLQHDDPKTTRNSEVSIC